MKVEGDGIGIGVWATNPTAERVVPVIRVEADVEDGDTCAGSGE